MNRVSATLTRSARRTSVTRRRVDPRLDGATLLVLTLCVFVGTSAVMAWTGWWHPTAGVALTAIVGLAGTALLMSRRLGPATRARDWRERYPLRRTLFDIGVLVLAAAAWIVALTTTDLGRVGQFGLLATITPTFFLAPVLGIAGFVAELLRGARRGLVLGAYLGLLILILHATTPLLLDEPQYAWTYKHVGVIELVLAQGQLTAGADIYQQWPAFFTAAAQLGQFLGVSPMSIAPWAPAFFAVLSAVLIFAIARTLSPDRRVAWGTAGLFVCLNWIEEDYLSPQGLAFVLSLAVFYLVLRYLRGGATTARYTPWQRALSIGALVLTMATLTATHQLSPFLVVAIVVAFAVFRVIRPWWIALIVAAIPVLYLLPRFEFISGSFGFFDSFDIFRNAGGNGGAWGTVGQAASAIAVRVLSLSVWALAGWAVWRSRHAFRRVLAPVLAAVIPFSLVLAQSYGGEAIYRVFLFSAPWCAFLIAGWALWGPAAGASAERSGAARERDWSAEWKARPRVKAVLMVVVAAGMFFATVQGRQGQLVVDRQSSLEVTAARYLYANAQPGATIMLVTPNFPSRVSANYGEFNKSVSVGEPDLITGAKLKKVRLNPSYLPAIESFAGTFPGTTTYLVVSNGMRRYAAYFGALPEGSIDTLEQTLRAAPEWSVFYTNPDVTIYQLTK